MNSWEGLVLDNRNLNLRKFDLTADLGKIRFRDDITKLIEQNAKTFDSLGPVFESVREMSLNVSSSLIPMNEALKELSETLKVAIQLPSFQLTDSVPLFDSIHRSCINNTKYGWCMSAHISIGTYRSIANSIESQSERDMLFVEEFESDDFRLYNKEKQTIILSSKQGWRTFYEECFYLIDNQMYQAVVPSLISAIEHELSYEQTNDIGKSLIRRVKTAFERDEDSTSFLYAISTSVLNLLHNMIFRSRDFDKRRLPMINRNWVLHGRDTPSLWNKEDVYKLITMISALRMLNKYITNE